VKERVLHIIGQHCRPETAEREFAATRRKHRTQGATRKSPAKYELPEPGEIATHIRKTRPNGRRYWAVAREGETATHMRREGEVVKQAEARHLITSFALDEVNPDDLDQVARAFAYTAARHAALYPGEQVTFVGQAEGKGRKFHVHTTRNATLFADMEVDGKFYGAGSKLAGDLTDIDKMRERADAFLAEHGAAYGLGPQRLASVKDQKREKRSVMDRRMTAKGEISNHDIIRDACESSMDDPRSVDLDTFAEVMAEQGVEVTAPGWRRGKPPKLRRLSYKTAHMGTPVRGESLGAHYDYAGAVAQLEAKAAGQMPERRPEHVQAGPPRPVAVPTADELAEAQAVVAQLAREESLHVWLDDWAREEYMTVEEMLAERALSLDVEEDRDLLHTKMLVWKAAQQTVPPHQTAPQTRPTPLEGKAQAQPQVPPDPEPPQQAGQPERAQETSELKGFPSSEEPPSMTGYGSTDDIRNAAETTEKREQEQTSDPTSSAPTPVRTVTPATLAQGAGDKPDKLYRSRLRDVRLENEKSQVHVDAMAVFDELAHEVLLRGERIDESTVARIGPEFMKQLGDRLDPMVREQMQMRQVKMQVANKLNEQRKRTKEQHLKLRNAGEREDPTGWQFSPEVRELIYDLKLANRRLATLRKQIDSGVYEVVSHSLATPTVREAEPESQRDYEPGFDS